MHDVKIIGVSGISGSGKSTFVKALSKRLNASCLYWDTFDEISRSPDDYVDWFDRGKDYSEFDYQALADSLCQLKSSNSIIHPVTREKIATSSYIIIEAPLGKAHQQTGKYIDFFIHIDIPLDIALSRRMIRDAKDPTYTKEKMLEGFRKYLTKTRRLFDSEGMCLVINSADYMVDGTQEVDRQVEDVLLFLNQVSASDVQNIKVHMVDKIDDEIARKMRDSFVELETKNLIDVNYKKFSLVMSRNTIIMGILNAYTAFGEIYVDDLWIDKDFRGKGYGRALLRELENKFSGKGFNNINLVTSEFQAPEFYKKCGYKTEFKRINEKNPKLTKTFFVKFFGEERQNQGIIELD